jgi:hypothetical protein
MSSPGPIKNSHFPSPALLGILSLGAGHIYSPTSLQVIMWMCLKTLQVFPVLKGRLLHYPRAFWCKSRIHLFSALGLVQQMATQLFKALVVGQCQA